MMTLPGCWDYQRINYRDQVIGIGIEPVEGNPDLLRYTFQVPDLSQEGGGGDGGGGGGGGGSEEKAGTPRGPYRNYTTEARSIGVAIAMAQLDTDKTLFFGNLQVVLLNLKLLNKQIADTIDELMRNPATDKLSYVLFTDNSVSEILNTKETVSPSDHISQWMEGGVRQQAFTVRTRLWEFWRDGLSYGTDPKASLISNKGGRLTIGGLVALHQMTPSVQLTPQQTMGYNLAVGHTTRVSVAFKQKDNIFTVGDIQAHSHLRVLMDRGKPVLSTDIDVKGVLVQAAGSSMGKVTRSQLLDYERTMERTIREQVAFTIHTMQKGNTDPFGFGVYYVIHHPEDYAKLNETWPKLYANAKLQVKCHVVITRKGILM